MVKPTRQSPRRGSRCFLTDRAAQRRPPLASGSRLGFSDLLDLVVFLVGIDPVEIVPLPENVLRGQQSGFNRVIGVVVAERAIPADDLDILQTVDECLDLLERLFI